MNIYKLIAAWLLCLFFYTQCHATHLQATNADNITTGTLPNERLDESSVTLRGQLTNGTQTLIIGSMTVYGTVTSTSGFVGVGSSLTMINANNIELGVLPNARLDSSSVTLFGPNVVTLGISTPTKNGGLTLNGDLTATKLIGDGSGITNIGGFVSLNATQTFTGQNTFTKYSQFNSSVSFNNSILSTITLNGSNTVSTMTVNGILYVSSLTLTGANVALSGSVLNVSVTSPAVILKDGRVGVWTNSPLANTAMTVGNGVRSPIYINTGATEESTIANNNWDSPLDGDAIIFAPTVGGKTNAVGKIVRGTDGDIIYYTHTNNASPTFAGHMFFTSNSGNSNKKMEISSAVIISGDLDVNGTLTKAAGSFKIPHPLYEDKWLIHGFVESNKYGLIYDGESSLVNGSATIDLPSYFEAIAMVEGRRITLTCVDGWSPLYLDGKIANGKFTVKLHPLEINLRNLIGKSQQSVAIPM